MRIVGEEVTLVGSRSGVLGDPGHREEQSSGLVEAERARGRQGVQKAEERKDGEAEREVAEDEVGKDDRSHDSDRNERL